jgi:hypothetical protein
MPSSAHGGYGSHDHHPARSACRANARHRLARRRAYRAGAGRSATRRLNAPFWSHADKCGLLDISLWYGLASRRNGGTGSFNGAGGYAIEWVLTDEGEPGRSDGWSIVVRDPAGRVVLSEDGPLDGGNHQAHAG